MALLKAAAAAVGAVELKSLAQSVVAVESVAAHVAAEKV